MVDLSDKPGDQEISSRSGENVSISDKVMTCTDCGTTKTPLWRGGPAGPKSLCNACGIRNRKRRRALLGLNKASTEHKKPKKINSNKIICTDTDNGTKSNLGNSIESNFFAFRVPMTWQKTKVRRKLGQEERAARLLMALSCGSVYA